jgi:Predicted membrane protein (DUF2078).
MSSPARRARQNAIGIVSTVVTGVWLAALFLNQEWWLPFMLFGYVVLVPVTAMLFGDEEEITEWWDGEADTVGEEKTEETDPLEQLRGRYARGELTEEQFERKLDRLLETETLEDIEDEKRRAGGRERGSRRERERERE